MRRELVAVVLALAALAGCATVATHEEYARYRAVRIARTEPERLRAMAAYASAHPGGLWSGEIRGERERVEQSVWERHNGTLEGLELYLAAFPDGRFVDFARERVIALSTVTERRSAEEERALELERQRRAQLAERRRLWAQRAVGFWVRTLLSIEQLGAPIGEIAQAHPRFAEAFGQRPEPLCSPERCIKHYHLRFALPVPGGTRIDRELRVLLRLVLDQGRLLRVELLMPERGFSRWYELEQRTVSTDEDPTQRFAAIESALGHIEPIVAELWAGAESIDVIPEPIAPISTADMAASARPEDSQVPGAASDDAEIADGEIEEGAPSLAGTPPPSELVLPIGLRALRRGPLRLVVFAAADDDLGAAYDGFYIELARE